MTVAYANTIYYNHFHSLFPFLFPLKSVFSASYPLIFMFSFVGFPLSLVRISSLSMKGKLFPVKIKKRQFISDYVIDENGILPQQLLIPSKPSGMAGSS